MHSTSTREADVLQQAEDHTEHATPVSWEGETKLQVTRDLQNMTPEDWKNIARSRESQFLLQHLDGRVRMLHPNWVL